RPWKRGPNMRTTDCPEQAELAGFAAGALSRPRMVDIARHVSQCAGCDKALASLDEGAAPPLLAHLRGLDLPGPITIDYVPAPLLAAARSALASAREVRSPNAGPPPRRVGRFELLE